MARIFLSVSVLICINFTGFTYSLAIADEKPGVCPDNTIIGTCMVEDNACRNDYNCADELKCCPRGCGLQCVKPIRTDGTGPKPPPPPPPGQLCVDIDEQCSWMRTRCPNGPAIDPNTGCPLCECMPATDHCAVEGACAEGQQCTVERDCPADGTSVDQCKLRAVCKDRPQCMPPNCDDACRDFDDWSLADGPFCPYCFCINSCLEMTCSAGEHCEERRRCDSSGICSQHSACAADDTRPPHPPPGESCSTMRCPRGEHCEVRERCDHGDQTAAGSCTYGAVCVKDDIGPQPSLPPEPEERCTDIDEHCSWVRIRCPNGPAIDPNTGCPICECKPATDPCTNHRCPEGTTCEVITIFCFTTPCREPYPECKIIDRFPAPTPAPAPAPGPMPNPCDTVRCKHGTECKVTQCPQGSIRCQPRTECVPITPVCSEVDCGRVRCAYGFVKDSADCKTCKCEQRSPCENVQCRDGEHCTVEMDCKRSFRKDNICTYSAKCKPCRRLRCPRKCPNGYQQGRDGCPTCACITQTGPCDSIQCGYRERCQVDTSGTASCTPIVYKDGRCPVERGYSRRDCSGRTKCTYDDNCDSTDKCCRGVCGKTCTPIRVNRAGFCPVPDELGSRFGFILGLLRDRDQTVGQPSSCNEDAECADSSEKCCFSLETLSKACDPPLADKPEPDDVMDQLRQLILSLLAPRRAG